MAIKKIRVKNFKSFKDLEVELGNLNILIGANASGKSNFVEIFKFLRDIRSSGLENAISMQGGVEYLRNINIGALEDFLLEVVSDVSKQEGMLGFWIGMEELGLRIHETVYRFAIEFKKKGLGFRRIAEDQLTYKCDSTELDRRKKGVEKTEIKSGDIVLSNVNSKVDIRLDIPGGVTIRDRILPPFLRREKLPPKTLLLETPLPRFLMRYSPSGVIFGDVSIYDFDPKLPKKAVPITGKAELEEDGSNLAIVLRNIIETKNEKRKLFNLVAYLLPFVDDLGVERFADKSLLFKLREAYSEKQYLPASLISDGTINMIALIIALYFEKKPLVIIEEPERNIHPHLISKVVRMMEDASHNKQIIVTTHNPEMVKHADPRNILLVSRDEDGFSSISRLSEISDKERIRVFLENDIGIEELYVDNLLGI